MTDQKLDIEKRPAIGDKPLDELGIDGLWVLASRVAKSEIVPKEMRGKPENVYLAALWARENNVPVIQALQGVYVVNGRLSVFGDLFLAQIQRSPDYAKHKEFYEGQYPSDNFTAVCQIWRKGHEEPFQHRFSIGDAKAAKLWGKAGPWSQYPKRMLMMRARTFAGRDGFADALKGISTVEEVRDIEEPRPVGIQDITAGRSSAFGDFGALPATEDKEAGAPASAEAPAEGDARTVAEEPTITRESSQSHDAPAPASSSDSAGYLFDDEPEIPEPDDAEKLVAQIRDMLEAGSIKRQDIADACVAHFGEALPAAKLIHKDVGTLRAMVDDLQQYAKANKA